MASKRGLAPVALGLLLTLTGCTTGSAAGGSPSGGSPRATAAVPSGASPGGSPDVPASPSRAPITAEPTLEPPPEAALVAGDMTIPGALGAWTWRGGSESAPWLPAPALDAAAIAPGTEMTIRIAGDAPLERWSAIRASADDIVGADTEGLGEGVGPVVFAAPDEPSVVAVHLVFADGAGDATWYWLMAPS